MEHSNECSAGRIVVVHNGIAENYVEFIVSRQKNDKHL
jgi:glucosamine 6-phosphate synthetase-like amidotransferase/phosphosugar isomerase protein